MLTAVSTGFVLSVAGFFVIAQLRAVAALGPWSVTSLADRPLTQLLAGGVCAAVVVLLLGRAAHRMLLTGGDLARAAVACHRLGHGAGGLIIIEDDQPDAYALPGGDRVADANGVTELVGSGDRRMRVVALGDSVTAGYAVGHHRLSQVSCRDGRSAARCQSKKEKVFDRPVAHRVENPAYRGALTR